MASERPSPDLPPGPSNRPRPRATVPPTAPADLLSTTGSYRTEGEEIRGRASQVLMVGASFVIVVAGLKAASTIILPFLGAIFLALISLPLLNWLRAQRIPAAFAVPVTLVSALGLLAGIVFVLSTSVRRFTSAVPRYQERLNSMYAELLAKFHDYGINLNDQLTTQLIEPGAALDVAQRALAVVVAVLSNFLLVLLIIAFVLFEAAGFPDKLQAAFGKGHASERYEKIRDEIQRYLGIKTLISITTGSLVYIALTIIGVDFALLWATLAFLLNYIPNLGSIIASIPPILLAVVQKGPGAALAVAVVYAVINVTMGNLLEPYFMGRRFGLSTLVVFISLVFWGWVWGPLGMLLSVPLTMILKIMLENTEDMKWVAVLLGPAERGKRD